MKRLLIAAVLLVLCAAPGRPYEYSTYAGRPRVWFAGKATVNYDPGITGSWVSAINSSLATWTGVATSSFQFKLPASPSPASNVMSNTNGYSDIYFDSTLGPYAYAVTFDSSLGSNAIIEKDVAFNNDSTSGITWTTNPTNIAGGPADFETVCVHELGHVLGLGHEDGVDAVMNSGQYHDPAIARRNLRQDDIDGVTFLYPLNSPTTGADLRIGLVTFSPLAAGPGDTIDVTYEVRNAGTDPVPGSYRVNAYLTGSIVPNPQDPFLGYRTDGMALAVDAEATSVMNGLQVSKNLPPGHWKVGVILDPAQAISDLDRSNNAGASLNTIHIERPAVAVPPGIQVSGRVGPQGRDSFTMELLEGTVIKLKGSNEMGNADLRIHDGASLLLTSKVGRRPKLKFPVPADGTYTIHLGSKSASVSEYTLKSGGKVKKKSSEKVVNGITRIPVPVYVGSTVKIATKCRGGLVADFSIDGATADVKPNRKATSAKIGPFTPHATGLIDIVVTPRDGTTGSARWKLTVKIPKKPPSFAR